MLLFALTTIAPAPIHSPTLISSRIATINALDIADSIVAAPPAAQAAAAIAVAAAAAAAALPKRRISFSTIDEREAVSYLRSFPTQAFQIWGDIEWKRLGAPGKLDFSVRPIDNGVRFQYFLNDEQARSRGLAGLVEDGGFELAVQGKAIVGRSMPGVIKRAAQEEVIWQRLVLQITKGIALERAGGRPTFGKVQGVYPCSMEKEIAYMAQRRASDSLWKRY